VVAALMASIGRSGTASSSRIRAMLLAPVGWSAGRSNGCSGSPVATHASGSGG
jgi:hypothetical protein